MSKEKAPFCSGTWTTPVRLGIFRAGALDATPVSGSSEVRDAAVELEDFSTQAEMVEQAHAEQTGPSIEGYVNFSFTVLARPAGTFVTAGLPRTGVSPESSCRSRRTSCRPS